MVWRRDPRSEVFQWFLARTYVRRRGVIIAGTRYTILMFTLRDREEFDWARASCWVLGVHMFASSYDYDTLTWDCELRIPRPWRDKGAADTEEDPEEADYTGPSNTAGLAPAPPNAR